jgi:hypothetical protein
MRVRSQVADWLERQALRGVGRRRSRAAAALLIWAMPADYQYGSLKKMPKGYYSVSAVARIAGSSRDPWVSHRTIRALERRSDDPEFLRFVLARLIQLDSSPYGRGEPFAVTPDAIAFLLAPVPTCPYVPNVRLVRFLSAAEASEWLYGSASQRDVASWTVATAIRFEDEDAHGDLSELLSATDQPRLLDALEEAFRLGVSDAQARASGKDPGEPWNRYRLWKDRRPAILAKILLANPHLPRAPGAPAVEPTGTLAEAHGVLLSVLKDRPDLVRASIRRWNATAIVQALLLGTGLPAPTAFADTCRLVLRTLDPGPARESVCERAMDGYDDATAAAVEAGYLPEDEARHLVFLFLTEQWDRYDQADPDGSLLREYCARRSGGHAAGHERLRIMAVATRNGRPDPWPRPPVPPARSGPPPRPSVGSWPTSLGIGGLDGGGGHSSGGGHGGFGHF